MTRAGDRPSGARSFTGPDQQEWDAALAEFNANVAAQYGTKKIETEPSMTRIDPTMTAAEIAAEMSYAGRHLPVDDQYQQRTYQVLLSRGQPPAEAQSGAQFWARLKAADPAHVFGPADDLRDPTGTRSNVATITVDPVTGTRTYQAGYQPFTPRGFAATPPVVLETSRVFGGRFPINRYALAPGREYVAQAVPSSELAGEGPTFFASGDLPPMTGSGADPSILPWCSWEMRHSGAFTDSASHLLEIVEASAEGIVEAELQNEAGRAALGRYVSRIFDWGNTIPADDREMSEAEFAHFYGPDADSGD